MNFNVSSITACNSNHSLNATRLKLFSQPAWPPLVPLGTRGVQPRWIIRKASVGPLDQLTEIHESGLTLVAAWHQSCQFSLLNRTLGLCQLTGILFPPLVLLQSSFEQASRLMLDIVHLRRLRVALTKDLHSAVKIHAVIVHDHARNAGLAHGVFQATLATAFLVELLIGSRAISSMSSWRGPTHGQIAQADAEDDQTFGLADLD